MLQTLLHRLKWSYRKNIYDMKGIIGRRFPDFILAKNPASLNNQIPIFVLHGVKVESFSAQLEYLHRNKYQTITIEELYPIVTGRRPCPSKTVVLTFDDGWSSLYTVSWPLLKKYGFRATSYLVPGLIREQTESPRLTLEDVWAGKATIEDVEAGDRSDCPLATWQEIRTMHDSGIIDFQAHSMYHHLISVSPKVIDFIHPNFPYYRFGPINVPVFQENGQDMFTRNPLPGTPIYESEPRYYSRRRYFDSEDLRHQCVQFVQENGGTQFFQLSDWRKRLNRFYRSQKRKTIKAESFETEKEQCTAIEEDLLQTREHIERRLPAKQILHLCYPWFLGSDIAVEMSKRTGYLSNVWGTLFDDPLVHEGSDPYYLSRIEDIYIYRLPGSGRKSLASIMQWKFGTFFPGFMSKLSK